MPFSPQSEQQDTVTKPNNGFLIVIISLHLRVIIIIADMPRKYYDWVGASKPFVCVDNSNL